MNKPMRKKLAKSCKIVKECCFQLDLGNFINKYNVNGIFFSHCKYKNTYFQKSIQVPVTITLSDSDFFGSTPSAIFQTLDV